MFTCEQARSVIDQFLREDYPSATLKIEYHRVILNHLVFEAVEGEIVRDGCQECLAYLRTKEGMRTPEK